MFDAFADFVISSESSRVATSAKRAIPLFFLLTFPSFYASAQNYGSGFTASGLTLNAGASISGTRLRLTDGKGNEARSAFFTTKVNVQAFTNDFSFQLTSAAADGFTFTIQGNNSNALGAPGGALGYGANSKNTIPGIGNSLAVGFQLYSSALGNKKVSLTGDWTEGASPAATPGSNTTGINLHSGDVMKLHMTYDGATLTWTITDSVTKKSFSKSLSINNPGAYRPDRVCRLHGRHRRAHGHSGHSYLDIHLQFDCPLDHHSTHQSDGPRRTACNILGGRRRNRSAHLSVDG